MSMALTQAHHTLQGHVRHYVKGYCAAKGLTIDHDIWTISEAEDALDGIFKLLPLLGEYDVTMPNAEAFLDPIGLFLERLYPAASNLKIGDDRMPLSQEAVNHLKSAVATLKTRAPSDWTAHALNDHRLYALSPLRTLDVLLSRSSQRATPILGQGNFQPDFPTTLTATVGKHFLDLQPQLIEDSKEKNVNPDVVLGLRYPIDTSTQAALRDLVSTLPSRQRQLMHKPNRYVQAFLENNTTSRLDIDPRPKSPPLFPRRHRHSANAMSTFQIDMLPELIGGFVEVSSSPEDIPNESLKLVDGWSAPPNMSEARPELTLPRRTDSMPDISSSEASSQTPTPKMSQSSQFDTRHFDDSSDPAYPLWTLEQAKLDPILIPRRRAKRNEEPATNGNGPGITHFTEIGLEPVAQPVFKPPASLSGANTTAISILEEEPHPDDLDGTLEHIYQPIRGLQAGTLIIRERLDNKRSLFMDPPIIRDRHFGLPGTICMDNVARLLDNRDQNVNTPIEAVTRLRKIQGLAALTMALKWRPFISGETGPPPTMEFLADAEPTFRDMETRKFVGRLEKLFEEAQLKPEKCIAVEESPVLQPPLGPVLVSRRKRVEEYNHMRDAKPTKVLQLSAPTRAGDEGVAIPNSYLVTDSSSGRLSQLLRLRGRTDLADKIPIDPPTAGTVEVSEHQPIGSQPDSVTQDLPPDFLANSLPAPICVSTAPVKYIASFALLQRRGLVHALASLNVELIDRPTVTDDLHLILSARSAVIFFVLAALPAELHDLVARLCRLSASFSRILVVFEAFAPVKSRVAGPVKDVIDSWFAGPPIINAFIKLRRALVIAQATSSWKGVDCSVDWAFAQDVESAATFAKSFDPDSEKEDRNWLVEAVYEGEAELVALEGINAFSAVAILSRVNLDSFLWEMQPTQRVAWFCDIFGEEWITRINSTIQKALQTAIVNDEDPAVIVAHNVVPERDWGPLVADGTL